MTYFAFCIAVMVAWRLYDGRGYPFSEAASWVIGVALGAFTFGVGVTWWQMLHGAGVGVLATWCIVRGYNGWDDYRVMLFRSLPALFIIPWCVAAHLLFGVPLSPAVAAVITFMCIAANVTEVPLRRWQHRMDATLPSKRPFFAKWSAHISEGYEAAWIGAAIAVAGWEI